ncbi:hypothetical protein RH831_09375 [Halodesulfurarchaeum sp. HSR-GB]|uniref:hypothetical protein n=1 Tax=Halodesulfurarchaeum sp. HSR-GB TaxID=3074077 RepID=UPI002863CEA2|nr:hypothetical protein [Halodesulfurarchaeum sp. HSR-GB]MDR5657389.1 hypothetical protein [Halodesulfurarchaeum sp. HSR-GB]
MTAEKLGERVLARFGSKLNYGYRPLDYEWDVLIILDACRSDLFDEFAPQHEIYERFDSVSSKYSCASTSREWFKKGFGAADDEQLSEVHYVTQNPFISKVDLDRFHQVEALWELTEKAEQENLDPSTVTNFALKAYAKSNAPRFVVHYIPPHAPFLHCVDRYDLSNKSWGGNTHDVWFGLQTGEYDHKSVWRDYGKNLLHVLDEVQRLTKHVEGNVVISADHANGMGEMGIYGHPGYVPHPAVKKVPWVEMRGEGINYEIDELAEGISTQESEGGVQGRLEALGYV